MKYLIVLVFLLSGVGVLTAQTSKDAKLRRQLYEIANKYISSSDLSKQNTSDPKCEPFDSGIADEFIALFIDSLNQVQLPNIYSDALLNYFNSVNKKAEKIKDADLYITFNDYYSMVQGNQNLQALTYIPDEDGVLNVNLYKHEKKVKGNQYQSVIGFFYRISVCKGDNSYEFKSLPVRLTCVYNADTTETGYSYPKIAKVEIEELASQWRYDFYITPQIGYSSGKLLMEEHRILDFENHNTGNQEFGALIQLKIPNAAPKFSPSFILGIGYRQIDFKHELSSLSLDVTDEESPITPLNAGLITQYKKEMHLNDIVEETRLKMITVPVGMGFDLRLGNLNSKRLLYFNPTITLGFPLAYKSSYTSGTVDYIGHFNIAGPSQPFSITVDDFKIDEKRSYGYDYAAKSGLEEYPLKKISVAAEVEAGYKYKINPSTTLNFGCFLSYGLLNNFSKTAISQSQITSWNGELLSYPYYSSPTRNLLFGFRLSVQRFAFQLKKKNSSIGSYNSTINR
ncbi:MAG: hypothetical protein JZU47_13660 [Prolixibacteraceae bacterium]|nr:hypothetical protein [Prolixibacteraceae bacterium]